MFLPVSGPVGTGEYMRCRIIAEAAQARWSNLRVSFALSRQAPYLESVPFETFRLDRSPTLETRAVCSLLRRERPDVVVFDNAGRTAQLACARAVGARTVFISRRAGKRRRAFRLRWLSLLDAHWIAFPPCIDGPLSALERLKLRWAPHLEVVFLGAVLGPTPSPLHDRLLSRLGLSSTRYVLFTGGGGPRTVAGEETSETLVAAARALAAAVHVTTVVVTGQTRNAATTWADGVRTIPWLPHAGLMDVMQSAHLTVVNGGTTMTQALALGRVCVTVPLAGDQHRRIERCSRLGMVVRTHPNAAAISDAAVDLMNDPARYRAVPARVAAAGKSNRVARALASLAGLLEHDGKGP